MSGDINVSAHYDDLSIEDVNSLMETNPVSVVIYVHPEWYYHNQDVLNDIVRRSESKVTVILED